MTPKPDNPPTLVPTEPGWYIASSSHVHPEHWEVVKVLYDWEREVYVAQSFDMEGPISLRHYDFHSRIAMPGETETEERKEG